MATEFKNSRLENHQGSREQQYTPLNKTTDALNQISESLATLRTTLETNGAQIEQQRTALSQASDALSEVNESLTTLRLNLETHLTSNENLKCSSLQELADAVLQIIDKHQESIGHVNRAKELANLMGSEKSDPPPSSKEQPLEEIFKNAKVKPDDPLPEWFGSIRSYNHMYTYGDLAEFKAGDIYLLRRAGHLKATKIHKHLEEVGIQLRSGITNFKEMDNLANLREARRKII